MTVFYRSEVRSRWLELNRDRARVEHYIELAELAGLEGSPLLAYDIVHQAMKRFPDHLRLRQIGALNLARSGSPLRGVQLLEPLLDKIDEEESYGILGRCYKDLWQRSKKREKKKAFLDKAASLYCKGYEITGGTYTGINASALSILMGNEEQGKKIATRVYECVKGEEQQTFRSYWALATLAEALLILGRKEEAEMAYWSALQHPKAKIVDIASTRKQAKLLCDHLGIGIDLERILHLPSVVVCTGHMLDHPDRKSARFPGCSESWVKGEIVKKLDFLDAGMSYSSAACGTDLLLIEAMLERGGEVHIVLPFCEEDFIQSSVEFAGKDWVDRFKRAVASCHAVHQVTADAYMGDDGLFQHCNQVMEGLAWIHAKSLGLSPQAICVWDGSSDGELGGTAQFVDELRQHGVEVDPIPPLKDALGGTSEDLPSDRQFAPRSQGDPLKRQIKSLLFADVRGFSRLKESQYPAFHRYFLSRIHELTEDYFQRIEFMNTWGDAIHAVFSEVYDCVSFAIDLRDQMSGVDWTQYGLPKDLSLRISLHVGPVYEILDPFLKQKTYFGRHVSQAARIEPITTPGCIFASEQVAALVSHDSETFVAEYVGRISLAKGFGVYPIYQIRRVGDIE